MLIQPATHVVATEADTCAAGDVASTPWYDAVMFNGKPRAVNSREIPVSRETDGKSLSLPNSLVMGISRSSGNSRATGNSRILEAITFSHGIQITI